MWDAFFAGDALLFSLPALFGTLVFSLRLLLTFTGLGGADHTIDSAHASDFAHAGPDSAHPGAAPGSHDTTHLAQFLSIQSVIAFAMGFGWTGLIAKQNFGLSVAFSALLAALAGVASVYAMAALFRAIFSLRSDGTVHIASAVGLTGDVYVSIPAQGTGQVRVVIENRQRIYNASSPAGPIPTSARVHVVSANPDNTLTVAPLADRDPSASAAGASAAVGAAPVAAG